MRLGHGRGDVRDRVELLGLGAGEVHDAQHAVAAREREHGAVGREGCAGDGAVLLGGGDGHRAAQHLLRHHRHLRVQLLPLRDDLLHQRVREGQVCVLPVVLRTRPGARHISLPHAT
eukprot:1072750-Rhodomonas_salina.2